MSSKRQLCEICLRPVKTCICKHVRPVSNAVSLIVLQHPQEVYEAKNSGKLLNLCLKNSQIYTGEVFDENFFQQIQSETFYDLLLYPHTPEEKSIGISQPPEIDHEQVNSDDNLTGSPKLRLWVLDGTWRKSRKMLYLNSALQSMPRLSLEDSPPSLYTIRKAHSENQLSTLEASCYALQQLERYAVDYSPVLSAFAAFIAEQKAFLPSSL
jgi:DTW domain-containing protein YfiP